MKFSGLLLCILAAATALHAQEPATEDALLPYVQVLRDRGESPRDYVLEQLQRHDLLIFDDALHSAVEPFDFYRELVADTAFTRLVSCIFLEVIPVNRQQCLDAYMTSVPEQPELLYPAFQDDFSGFGWPYQTYFDLLHAVYTANRTLPEKERLRVIAVSNPAYWCDLQAPADVDQFRKGLAGRDYDMYKQIMAGLDNFRSGKKGVFLTNTRHAYTGIKRRDGAYFWDTGTFFRQWHPHKTVSIRFHGPALYMEARRTEGSTPATTEGMEQFSYRWGRMADGLWDRAFEALGNRPLAVPLAGTAFGRDTYVGNHMVSCAPGQTMSDAYDAVIFLAPLEKWRKCAVTDAIYTPPFRREMVRRYRLLRTAEQMKREFEEYAVDSIEALIDSFCVPVPEKPLPQAQSLTTTADKRAGS